LGSVKRAAPGVQAHHLVLDGDCAGGQIDVPASKSEELAETQAPKLARRTIARHRVVIMSVNSRTDLDLARH
jgi:hypothetical protein